MHPMKVAFLYQNPVHWINVESIYENMLRDERFSPEIFLLPTYNLKSNFIVSHPERYSLPETKYLDEKGYKYKFSENIIEKKFDVAFYLDPYDQTKHENFKSAKLIQDGLPCYYVPYGIEIGGGLVNRLNQYNLYLQNNAAGIFVRSVTSKINYSLYCNRGDKHVYVTGLPIQDKIFDIKSGKFSIDQNLVSEIGNRFPIFWNSQYSFDGDLWSTFDSIFEPLCNYTRKNPGVVIIWRPHPWMLKKLSHYNILKEDNLDLFLKELNSNGIIVDFREDQRHALSVSKAIMSDASSLLFSAILFDKPVLYLKNKYGRGLMPEGESLINAYDVADNPEEVIRFIDLVRAGNDSKKVIRNLSISKYFFGFDGKVASRILEIVYKKYIGV